MEVNIWSDVRCPFCYIGKYKFEAALEKFEHKNKVKINWRSFELNPGLKTAPDINALDHLAKKKGISREQVDQMEGHVARAADEAGVIINSGKSVVANSFNSHRLIQYAKTKGLGNEAEEALFKAHFTEVRNIDDEDVLREIGTFIGLAEQEIKGVLSTDAFAEEVRADEEEARTLGINGVPFFVFNDKYAVSGAQPPNIFLDVLKQSWTEFEKEKPSLIINDGTTCSTDSC